jgi:hypothetical protein
MASRKKPAVYLDTTIPSAYWYDGRNLLALARRQLTREWWRTERKHFALLVSSVTEAELREGQFPRQRECLKLVWRLRFLPITRAAHKFTAALLDARIVPDNKPRDALQLAMASVHEVDYLLTWNYAHLANPVVQERLGKLCQRSRLRSPVLVSPETIPQVRWGQAIRRE